LVYPQDPRKLRRGNIAKTKVIHQGFDDPPKLAESADDEEEAMEHYRRVRTEIRTRVEGLTLAVREEAQ